MLSNVSMTKKITMKQHACGGGEVEILCNAYCKDCNATPGPLLSGHAQFIYFNDAMSITKR